MPSSTSIFALVTTMLLASSARGQSFDYPDFSSVSGLVLNGGAAQAGSSLRLTPNVGGQAASCYHGVQVAVNAGFQTTFEFQILNGGSGSGADGMSFIIHNDAAGSAALGDNGSALAYAGYTAGSGISNGLVIEIDTWDNGNGDLSDNEVSIHTSGTGQLDFNEVTSLGHVPPAVNMSDGAIHTLRVLHSGEQVEVFLDDMTTPIVSAAHSFSTGGTYIGGATVGGLDLANGSSAWVGFTASTGGVSEDHDVLSWSFTSGGLGTSYCLSVTNSTGTSAAISAAGSSSVAANDLTLLAGGVPDQPGLFFYGPEQIILPFGNGFRCVGGTIGRLGVVNATGGSMSYLLDNTMPPNAATTITPASTFNFQAWYRDPLAGGASFNLSDGLEILFSP